MAKTYRLDDGNEAGTCVDCGYECSTHEDANASLCFCGDCAAVVCNLCATKDAANRCRKCESEHRHA